MLDDPVAVAAKVGIKKVNKSFSESFVSAMLAGGFIAVAFMFYVTVETGAESVPWGISKLLGGLAFSLGLILVVICSVDLFTSSVLSIIPLKKGKVTFFSAIKNLITVYSGNFIGALFFVLLAYLSGVYNSGHAGWGATVLHVASHKLHHTFSEAVALGILCNFLVCSAVWMTFVSKTVTDKILAVIFPVTMFVACGFEHCVANMFMVPMGIVIRTFAPSEFWSQASLNANEFSHLTVSSFISSNLIPVTIGNFIGGAVLIGLAFWWISAQSNENTKVEGS